jgi:hypothetical protein
MLFTTFFNFLTFDKIPEINFYSKSRLLWHLRRFLAFLACTSLHKLAQACTSEKKFCAGLLMDDEVNLNQNSPLCIFVISAKRS